MAKAKPQSLIPIERIAAHIYLLRGQKVMLDFDLAELYGVPTKGVTSRNGNNRTLSDSRRLGKRRVGVNPSLRDRSFENQRYRASGLNLVVAAIVLWNTAYLERVVQALRDIGNADDSLLPHLSPLGWEHINLTGDYSWQQNKQVEQGNFRPLPPLTRP